MRKTSRSKKTRFLSFVALLCALSIWICACGTTDTPSETKDDTSESKDPSQNTETETETKMDQNPYAYPEGEYEALLEVFGKWEDNFAPGERTLTGLTEYTYDGTNHVYYQTRDAIEIDGPRTFASVDRPYSPAMHINTDAYVVGSLDADNYKAAGYEIIGHSGSFNKNSSFATKKDYHQQDENGSTDGFWNSLVLNKKVVESVNRTRLAFDVKSSTWFIGFVEPEMFRGGLYAPVYKDLWELKYQTEWEDPNDNVDATFMAERLNVWTHTNAIRMYMSFLTGKNPDFNNFYIAPHSTLAYTLLDVTDGYVHMMGTGIVKTVTGQTWSNTMENSFRYQGKSVQDPFINGLLDYGTYLDAADYYGADFYALCDPMSDTASSHEEAYWRNLCHHQLVASMMYPEINRWELIWTNRSFMSVSPEYRSEQLAIHNALLDISGASFKLTAGTPGITYLLSDTLSWQNNKKSAWAENAYNGFWGVAAPLLYDGIPLRTRAMELITSAKDLEGVSVLIVSYDNQKPLYENVNEGIADWVKKGGTLLLLGGPDAYVDVSDAFWNQNGKGGSPNGNLLSHLGLESIKLETLNKSGTLSWVYTGLSASADFSKITVGQDAFTYKLSGTGFEPVLTTSNGDVVAAHATAGLGNVYICGMSTTDFSDSREGAELLRSLVDLSLTSTEYTYETADAFVAERGDYVAVYPINGSYRLSGRYVNIFSNDLEILVDPVIKQGESALLYKMEEPDDQPVLCYAGGIYEAKDVELTDHSSSITVKAADNALIPIRFTAPEGLYPVEVTTDYGNGNLQSAATRWDAATNSLLVNVYTIPTNPATVTVTWGDKAHLISNKVYALAAEYSVKQNGTDTPFIVENTSQANGSNRYCDKDAYIIWRFDVSDYDGLQVEVSLSSNYVLQISPDGQNWQTVADYSKLSDVRASGTNSTLVNISAAAYDVSDTLYLRLSNTSPTGSWGGAVSKIAFYQLVNE